MRETFYFSTEGGKFVTWGIASGQIESSLRLGESLGGIDLSADCIFETPSVSTFNSDVGDISTVAHAFVNPG